MRSEIPELSELDTAAKDVMLHMYWAHMNALRNDREEWRKELFVAIGTLEKAFPKAKEAIDTLYPVEAKP